MATALILAVGQDYPILASRTAILRSAGYHVDAIHSVSEAITRFHNGDFDLVVLCHSIPQQERDRLARAIRASGSCTPILLVSPFADSRGLADAVIDTHPQKLLRIIEKALQREAEHNRAKEVVPSGNDRTRLTVLCIDDDPNSLQFRRMILEKAGYNVLTSNHFDYCLSIISTGIVDAVILDYGMSEMDCGAIAAQIRQKYKDVPLILYSGYSNPPQKILTLFDATIPRGASPQVLIDTLHEILSDPGKKMPSAQETLEDYFKFGTFH